MRRSLCTRILVLVLFIPLPTWAASSIDFLALNEKLTPDLKGCVFFVHGLNLLHKSGFLKDALDELVSQENVSRMLRDKADENLFWQKGMQPFLDEMAFLYALTHTSVYERWWKWAFWYGFQKGDRHPEHSLYRREKLASDKQLLDALPHIEKELIKSIYKNGHCASTHIRSMYMRWVHGEMYPVWRRISLYLFSQDVLGNDDTIQRLWTVLAALMNGTALPDVRRRPLTIEEVLPFKDQVVGIIEGYERRREESRGRE